VSENLTQYSWWSGDNPPPPNLKTRKQLAELKLRGVKAVSRIPTNKYTVLLFDIDDPTSVAPKRQPTEKQLETLIKNRAIQAKKKARHDWFEYYGGLHLRDRNSAIEWAKSVLGTLDDWVILDTETTGLGNAEIVQIGVLDLKGEVILDSLIKPSISIPTEAINIHGITDEMVANAPGFATIYPQIELALSGKKVLIYNKYFDLNILDYCYEINSCKPIQGVKKNADCVMVWYSQYIGDWNDYYQSYRWQKLNGDHSAIGDCRATLKVIQAMAAAEIVDESVAFEAYFNRLETKNN
jgi:DNA polymerase III subunit epsilon